MEHIKSLQAESLVEQQQKLERCITLVLFLLPEPARERVLAFTKGLSITHVQLLLRSQAQSIVTYYPALYSLTGDDTTIADILKRFDTGVAAIRAYLEEDAQREAAAGGESSILKLVAYLCYFIEQTIIVPHKAFFVEAAKQCLVSTSSPPSILPRLESSPQQEESPPPTQEQQLLLRAQQLKAEIAVLEALKLQKNLEPEKLTLAEKKQLVEAALSQSNLPTSPPPSNGVDPE